MHLVELDRTHTGCYWFFRVGDEVWTSVSRDNREAHAIFHKITKLR